MGKPLTIDVAVIFTGQMAVLSSNWRMIMFPTGDHILRAYTMTATNHDGRKPWPWRPQQWKREKLTPNVQLAHLISLNTFQQVGRHGLWPSLSNPYTTSIISCPLASRELHFRDSDSAPPCSNKKYMWILTPSIVPKMSANAGWTAPWASAIMQPTTI